MEGQTPNLHRSLTLRTIGQYVQEDSAQSRNDAAQRKARAIREQHAMQRYQFIPFAEFAPRFGITARDIDQAIYPTYVGNLQFWFYHNEQDGMTYIPLEDVAVMFAHLDAMSLFAYCELGNDDILTIRPHQLFEKWFADGYMEYTVAFLQQEVEDHEKKLEHYRKTYPIQE